MSDKPVPLKTLHPLASATEVQPGKAYIIVIRGDRPISDREVRACRESLKRQGINGVLLALDSSAELAIFETEKGYTAARTCHACEQVIHPSAPHIVSARGNAYHQGCAERCNVVEKQIVHLIDGKAQVWDKVAGTMEMVDVDEVMRGQGFEPSHLLSLRKKLDADAPPPRPDPDRQSHPACRLATFLTALFNEAAPWAGWSLRLVDNLGQSTFVVREPSGRGILELTVPHADVEQWDRLHHHHPRHVTTIGIIHRLAGQAGTAHKEVIQAAFKLLEKRAHEYEHTTSVATSLEPDPRLANAVWQPCAADTMGGIAERIAKRLTGEWGLTPVAFGVAPKAQDGGKTTFAVLRESALAIMSHEPSFLRNTALVALFQVETSLVQQYHLEPNGPAWREIEAAMCERLRSQGHRANAEIYGGRYAKAR
jgi:hypothetical protein